MNQVQQIAAFLPVVTKQFTNLYFTEFVSGGVACLNLMMMIIISVNQHSDCAP